MFELAKQGMKLILGVCFVTLCVIIGLALMGAATQQPADPYETWLNHHGCGLVPGVDFEFDYSTMDPAEPATWPQPAEPDPCDDMAYPGDENLPGWIPYDDDGGSGPPPDAGTRYRIMFSDQPSRADARKLHGQYGLQFPLAVFVRPDRDIVRVRFFLGNPDHGIQPFQIENLAPWDAGGTGPSPDRLSNPWGESLPDGTHVMTAEVQKADGSSVRVQARFGSGERQTDDDGGDDDDDDPDPPPGGGGDQDPDLVYLAELEAHLIATGQMDPGTLLYDGSYWAWPCTVPDFSVEWWLYDSASQPDRTWYGDCPPEDTNGNPLPPTEANGAVLIPYFVDFSPLHNTPDPMPPNPQGVAFLRTIEASAVVVPQIPWTPPQKVRGNILVWPGMIEDRRGPRPWNQVPVTGKSSLARAWEIANPGDAIQFWGSFPSLEIAGSNGSHSNTARRDRIFDRITMFGSDETASVGKIAISQAGGGTGNLVFRDFTIRCNGREGFITYAGTVSKGVRAGTGGVLTLWGIDFEREAHYLKWPIRGHGLHAWEVVECRALEGSQEWMGYFSNPQGVDGAPGVLFYRNEGVEHDRGLFQGVTRAVNALDSSGAWYVYGNRAVNCGYDGASAFTYAGLPRAAIYHVNNQSVDRGGSSSGYMVAYRDKKLYDLEPGVPAHSAKIIGPGYTRRDGYGFESMMVVDPRAIHVNADRYMMGLQGIRALSVVVRPGGRSRIDSNRQALWLEYGGQRNGLVLFFSRTSPRDWPWSGYQTYKIGPGSSGTTFDPSRYWVHPR